MRLSILGLLACIAISFTACEKSTVLTPDVLEANSAAKLSTIVEDSEATAKRGKCFDISGEVTYLLPDGTTVTGIKTEVKAEVKAWYEANPDSEDKAMLQFPIDIILQDETVSTINSQDELMAAKAACKEKRGGKGKGDRRQRCFEINGEVSYLLPDGTSVTGIKREVKTEIKAWYEANPDAEERPTLQFPVELIFEDESVQIINSQEELQAAKEACKE